MTFRRGRYGADPAAGSGSSTVLVTDAVFVDVDNGTDTRTGLDVHDQASPFATLEAAYAASASGDVIVLSPGEHVVAAKVNNTGRHIVGAHRTQTIVSCSNGSSSVFELLGGGSLTNLTVKGPTATGFSCVLVDGSQTGYLERVDFIGQGTATRAIGMDSGGIVHGHDLRLMSGNFGYFLWMDPDGSLDSTAFLSQVKMIGGSIALNAFQIDDRATLRLDGLRVDSGVTFSGTSRVLQQQGTSHLYALNVKIYPACQYGLVLTSGVTSTRTDVECFLCTTGTTNDIFVSGGLTNSANYSVRNAAVASVSAPAAYVTKTDSIDPTA